MGKKYHEDPIMVAIRKRIEDSGLTLQELGEKMGYAPTIARQSAWQFLNANDPKIGTLRRYADAVGVSLSRLLKE